MTDVRPLLIAIPTYNERQNVAIMYEQLMELKLDADLLFVDDNSPDGTGQFLDGLAGGDPRLKILHRAGKLGIGSAHLDAIRWAYEYGYSRLLTMDCDFSHSPADIPLFLGCPGGAGIVVGSRYLQRDSLREWNLLRKGLTTCGHLLTTRLLRMPQDATGAFRLYDLRKIDRRIFSLVTSMGYAFFFESLFVLTRNGVTVSEVPVRLPARTYGSSKMTTREVFRSVQRIALLWAASLTHPSRFVLK